jgi:hypothetical protein
MLFRAGLLTFKRGSFNFEGGMIMSRQKSPERVRAEYQLDAVVRLVNSLKLSKVVVEQYLNFVNDTALKLELVKIISEADAALRAAEIHFAVR